MEELPEKSYFDPLLTLILEDIDVPEEEQLD